MSRRVPHAGETPISTPKPILGKMHRAHLWSYRTERYDLISAAVFEFAESRAGKHARSFLDYNAENQGNARGGTRAREDHRGYKALFAEGITEAGLLAHERRKFHEMWVNNESSLVEQALSL